MKLAESCPIFLATLYVPERLCPGLESKNLATGSVIEFLQERYRYRITRVKGSFEAVLLGEKEADLLQMKAGSPAILYHRVRFIADGRALIASDHLIRSDSCQLSFEVTSSATH